MDKYIDYPSTRNFYKLFFILTRQFVLIVWFIYSKNTFYVQLSSSFSAHPAPPLLSVWYALLTSLLAACFINRPEDTTCVLDFIFFIPDSILLTAGEPLAEEAPRKCRNDWNRCHMPLAPTWQRHNFKTQAQVDLHYTWEVTPQAVQEERKNRKDLFASLHSMWVSVKG